MSTVAILGAGDIGGATAQALAAHDRVRRVLLVDAAGSAAAGKALDIRQTGAITGSHVRLDGTDDLSRVVGCSLCVVADRFAAGSPEWQGDEGLAMLGRVAPHLAGAPLIFAGTQQADLMASAARDAGFAAPRLIGSATEALASAVKSIVAMEAGCSPSEVMLTVLGVPPTGFVVPWSEASIGGYALEQTLQPVQLARLASRFPRLWPPGPQALGAAAALVAEAAIGMSRSSHAVLTLLRGEFGVRNRIGTLPAWLGPAGIIHTRVPTLSTRERVLVETSLGKRQGF
jgi:malate/lactate dehydrogenase